MSSNGPLITPQFCRGCGTPLVASASVCPSCGTAIKTTGAKDKTVAILLAVVFGSWTWLYTYQVDKTKFWIGTTLWFIGLFTTLLLFGVPILLGIWIWAIIDTAMKPHSFYANYPNEN